MKDRSQILEQKALKKAAKYICNQNDKLCPMAVEKIKCRAQCTLVTLPWQCWLDFFIENVSAEQHNYEKAE